MDKADSSLQDLRKRIDEIDIALHDLLMERARTVEEVAKAKGKGPVSRPGREAQVLRGIAERHQGSFPLHAALRIWREIITACSYIQGGFKVAYYSGDAGLVIRSLTRDHFGTLVDLLPCGSPSQVLQLVSEDENVIGVLPFPQSEEAGRWWPSLARKGEGSPNIIARLPFDGGGAEGHGEALAVSLIAPEPSGDDSSFLILELLEPVSRSFLKTLLEKAGLSVVALQAHSEEASSLQLVEISGFVAADDPALERLKASDDARIGQCWVIGAAARPLGSAPGPGGLR